MGAQDLEPQNLILWHHVPHLAILRCSSPVLRQNHIHK